MKQENVNFIKEKFHIDLNNYNLEEQEKIISTIEEYLKTELIISRKNNLNKNKKLKELLEEINDNLN